MTDLVYRHSRAIRYFHWINAPVLAVMIWSGLLIYWAYDSYEISIGGEVVVKFFPDWFYDLLDLKHGLAVGMAYHFAFAWLFAINGFLYVGYTFWSGHWRELRPTRRTPLEAWHVFLHDLKLRKQAPPAEGKFNAAQRLAYGGVVLMGAGSLLTGLALYKPTQLAWLTFLLGGYKMARLEHFVLTLGYLLFFAIHMDQVIHAGWNNFRGMVTGYALVRDAKPISGLRSDPGVLCVGRDLEPKPGEDGSRDLPTQKTPGSCEPVTTQETQTHDAATAAGRAGP